MSCLSNHSKRAEARHPSRLKRHLQPLQAVYKPVKEHFISQPTPADWVVYYAFVGSNYEFMCAVINWIMARTPPRER